jgi:hypothetical protein
VTRVDLTDVKCFVCRVSDAVECWVDHNMPKAQLPLCSWCAERMRLETTRPEVKASADDGRPFGEWLKEQFDATPPHHATLDWVRQLAMAAYERGRFEGAIAYEKKQAKPVFRERI